VVEASRESSDLADDQLSDSDINNAVLRQDSREVRLALNNEGTH
jgi:hypothetical protein